MDKKLKKELKEESARLSKIRENLGYTQEQFAHILGIDISTYKKIESVDRRMSLNNLKKLHKKTNVSVDYILFGDKTPQEQAWNGMLNCTETDKLILFLRLFQYLTQNRPEIFPVDEASYMSLDDVIRIMTKAQTDREHVEE